MRPIRHRLARLASFLALALWAPTSLAAAADAPRLHLEPFIFEVGDQRVEAELGELRVPENRATDGSSCFQRAGWFPSKPASAECLCCGGCRKTRFMSAAGPSPRVRERPPDPLLGF